MSFILNEPLELDGYLYPAGEPVEILPASVGERLCLNGLAVPGDAETADAFAAITLGDAVVPPPAELAALAVEPSADAEPEAEVEPEVPSADPVTPVFDPTEPTTEPVVPPGEGTDSGEQKAPESPAE